MQDSTPRFQSTLAAMSADARLLLNKLLNVEIDGRVSYAELSDLIGADVSPLAKRHHTLRRARDLAERDGVFFSAVKGNPDFRGLVRINHDMLVDSTGNVIHNIRRRATKQLKRLAAVVFDKLKAETQVTWNARFSHLQAIRMFSAPKIARDVEETCGQTKERIDTSKMLEMFEKKTEKTGPDRT